MKVNLNGELVTAKQYVKWCRSHTPPIEVPGSILHAASLEEGDPPVPTAHREVIQHVGRSDVDDDGKKVPKKAAKKNAAKKTSKKKG